MIRDIESNPRNIKQQCSNYYFYNKTRFIILILSIIVLYCVFGNGLLFNVTIICMTKDVNSTSDNFTNNFSTNTKKISMFDLQQQSSLYSAIAIGSLTSALTINYVINVINARYAITIYGLISGIATLIIPSISENFLLFFFMRILQGIGAGMSFSCIGYITSSWSPINDSGLFLSYLTLYIQLGPLITMPSSGYFCQSEFKWHGIYYLQGFLTIFFISLFCIFYRDHPRFHRNVSDKELIIIEKSKLSTSDEKIKNIPYKKILTDKTVLSSLLVCFGNFYGFLLFMQYSPVYLSKVIKFDVKSTGIMSALPYIGCIVLKFILGPLSDKLTCITQLTSVKLFTAISQFTMVGCYILLALISPSMKILAQIGYTITILGYCVNSIGYYKSIQLCAGKYSSLIMSWFSLINATIILILPVIKSFIASHDTPDEWSRLFYVSAVILFTTAIPFLFTASVEPKEWTYSTFNNKNNINISTIINDNDLKN